jgi:hypothetical protein
VSAAASAALGGALLAFATLLATIVSRLLPFGAPRRTAEDVGIILGCAAPALALLAGQVRTTLWAAPAIIGAGYGGFYLIRSRQLRRADRDGVRRLLGLHRDSSYGEALGQAERIEPRDLTPPSRAALAVGAATIAATGIATDNFREALAALALGAADATLRPAYRRALARKVRSIGH